MPPPPTAQSRCSVNSYAMKLRHARPFPVCPQCTHSLRTPPTVPGTNRDVCSEGQGKLGMAIPLQSTSQDFVCLVLYHNSFILSSHDTNDSINNDYLHFSDEETEVQRGPKSPSL